VSLDYLCISFFVILWLFSEFGSFLYQICGILSFSVFWSFLYPFFGSFFVYIVNLGNCNISLLVILFLFPGPMPVQQSTDAVHACMYDDECGFVRVHAHSKGLKLASCW